MAKIIGQIFEEENYDIFHRLPDNRDVFGRRLNQLIASISTKYILNPVIVNEKFEIIDGQGRFEALKTLGKPIHYIIVPGVGSDECRMMNKYNTKWTQLDFAKSFAKAGLQSYANLLKACELSKLTVGKAMRLANHGMKAKRSDVESAFERGELKFTQEDIQKVINTKELADEISEALQYTGRTNDAFLTGVKIISETEGYKHSRMLSNCKKQRASYQQMSRLSDQLIEFERIYNYNLSSKNKLYFSDYMRNKGANVRDYTKGNTHSPYTSEDISTLKVMEGGDS